MPRELRLIICCALCGCLVSACEEEETGDWIEVPLSPNTFFEPGNPYQEAEFDILVLRESALEFKLGLLEGDAITYNWTVAMTDPTLLNVEFHGHTERVGEAPGTVMFYKIHNDGTEKGSLVAPFDGIHGWYLDNQSTEDITVQLQVAGFFATLD